MRFQFFQSSSLWESSTDCLSCVVCYRWKLSIEVLTSERLDLDLRYRYICLLWAQNNRTENSSHQFSVMCYATTVPLSCISSSIKHEQSRSVHTTGESVKTRNTECLAALHSKEVTLRWKLIKQWGWASEEIVITLRKIFGNDGRDTKDREKNSLFIEAYFWSCF